MKKNITIEHNLSLWDLNDLTIDEMIDWLKEYRNELVKKDMLTATYNFRVNYSEEYESEFSMIREETDEEYNNRVKRESQSLEDIKRQIEAKEQADYLRLRQKYEGK